MGITTVWDMLSPAVENNVKISSLSGKTIAVDVSAWITQLKNTPNAKQITNIYIRNLYYRVLELMREGVKLVIVIDGRAPAVKHNAMQGRQEAEYGSASGTFNPDRPMLARAVQDCVELFKSLGLPCLYAEGEAEATCAHLNERNLVDGCISEDSDFFCYGGKTLYRNLRKEKGVYVVDKMCDLEGKAGLGRRDMVALALLLGCDYDMEGAESVGKKTAMQLFKYLKARDLDVLDRLKGWRDNAELSSIKAQISAKVKHQSHCKDCDHLGTISVHKKAGCSVCKTTRDCILSCDLSCDQACQCDWHRQNKLRNEHELEIKIGSNQKPAFPDPKIIDEFLRSRRDHSIQFDRIAVPRLVNYLTLKLHWSSREILDKVVPCFIMQQLWHPQLYATKMFHPMRINKSCTEKFVECYEVSWDKSDVNSWVDEAHSTSVLVKVEKALFERNYPHIVKTYEEARSAKQATKRSGKKRKSDRGSEGSGNLLTMFTSVKRKLNYNSDGVTASPSSLAADPGKSNTTSLQAADPGMSNTTSLQAADPGMSNTTSLQAADKQMKSATPTVFTKVNPNKPKGTKRTATVAKSTKKPENSKQSSLTDFFKKKKV